MQELEDRIRHDGIVKAGNVLKVDAFLNTSATLSCSITWALSGPVCSRASRSTRS